MNPQTRLWRRSLGHPSILFEQTGFDAKILSFGKDAYLLGRFISNRCCSAIYLEFDPV
jgi:hypothetical protein